MMSSGCIFFVTATRLTCFGFLCAFEQEFSMELMMYEKFLIVVF